MRRNPPLVQSQQKLSLSRRGDLDLQTLAPFGWATAANGRNEPTLPIAAQHPEGRVADCYRLIDQTIAVS